jgi:tape measure domain-containing protein
MAANWAVTTAFRALDQVSGVFNRMSKSSDKFGDTASNAFRRASKSGSRFGDIVKGVLTANIIQRGVGFMADGFKKIVGEASKMEDALAGYKILLGGSEEAAGKLVDQLVVLGAKTPFEFKDLSDATTMLLGFGAATKDNVIPMLQMLGDISMGNAEHLQGVALAFGQIKAAGKASMQDINQLVNNQVPILGELAKMWGVTTGEARNMVSKGLATADEVERAFKRMTSQGGLFYGAMIEKSSSFSGLMSTLSDSINSTASAIGMQMLPFLKDGAKTLIGMTSGVLEWVVANKELIKTNITVFVNVLKMAFNFIQPILSKVFGLFQNIGQSMAGMNWQPLIKALGIIGRAFSLIIDIIQILWKVAKPIIDGILFLLSPLVDLLSWIMTGVEKFASFIGISEKVSPNKENQTAATQSQITPPNQNQAAAQSGSYNGILTIKDETRRAQLQERKRGSQPVRMEMLGAQ